MYDFSEILPEKAVFLIISELGRYTRVCPVYNVYCLFVCIFLFLVFVCICFKKIKMSNFISM